ncbi:antibiotic biosynthesis monooxygenase [Kistimonas scapharcae]|uniref:Antibiotic biosynthesis monooxygenase n=1 Tax=Kistimonas scapharcae TaxID=1036133 RepID=A0ABP8V4P3_9GAMM
MNNELVFYVEFNVKPEAVDDFLKDATAVLKAMAKEDTFVCTYFHRDSENPCRFTLYERWREATMADFIKNQLNAKDYRKAYEATLPKRLASPRTMTVLEPIGEWRR